MTKTALSYKAKAINKDIRERVKELNSQGASSSYIGKIIKEEFGLGLRRRLIEKIINHAGVSKSVYDGMDLKILEILIKDAKKFYKQLGKEIGMSDVAIYKRIKKLEKNGIIERYTILIDPNKIPLEDYLRLYKDLPFLILDPSAVHLDDLEKLEEFYKGKNILYGGPVLISPENIKRFKEEIIEGVAGRYADMMKVYINSLLNK